VGAFQLRVYVSPQGPVGVAGRPIAPVGDAPLGDLEGAAGGDPQDERVDLGEDGADGLGPGEPVALRPLEDGVDDSLPEGTVPLRRRALGTRRVGRPGKRWRASRAAW
jgi:hypothetical protein